MNTKIMEFVLEKKGRNAGNRNSKKNQEGTKERKEKEGSHTNLLTLKNDKLLAML